MVVNKIPVSGVLHARIHGAERPGAQQRKRAHTRQQVVGLEVAKAVVDTFVRTHLPEGGMKAACKIMDVDRVPAAVKRGNQPPVGDRRSFSGLKVLIWQFRLF
jgi:hypothetical protein